MRSTCFGLYKPSPDTSCKNIEEEMLINN